MAAVPQDPSLFPVLVGRFLQIHTHDTIPGYCLKDSKPPPQASLNIPVYCWSISTAKNRPSLGAYRLTNVVHVQQQTLQGAVHPSYTQGLRLCGFCSPRSLGLSNRSSLCIAHPHPYTRPPLQTPADCSPPAKTPRPEPKTPAPGSGGT